MLRVEEQSDGSLRYRMLETVRASALTRLRSSDEDGHAQRAHADFYRTLVPIAPPAPWSIRDEHVQFDRLTIEHDNLRATLAWMLATDSQDLLAFTTDLTGFWWERGHGYEARTWCERALANDRGAPTIARARVLLRLGLLESAQDELHQALMHAEDSLRLARQLGSGEDAAAALGSLGGFLFDLGDLNRAGEHLQQSRDVYQNLGSQEGIAWASWRLSWVAEARGDIVEMEALASTVLEISRELGQPGGIAASLQQLGRAAKVRGDLGTAKAHFVEGRAHVEKFGMLGPIAGAVELLGDVAREEGELDEARTLLARSQAIYKQLGWTRAETFIQYRLAMLAADSGDISEAVRRCDQVLVELRQGEATWDLATVLIGAGRIRAARGDPSAGAANYHEGLSLFHDIGNAFGEAAAVRAIGVLAADCGRAREASRLLGSAMVKREALGAALLPSEQRQEAQATDLIVAALGDANFASLREEGRTLAWDVAITEALVMACDIAA
jgi:tetratricopeptide (TPR) repeat protein